MFSVSPDLFQALLTGSRWLFAFIALLLLFFAFSWLRAERKERRDKTRNLPGAGTVGELIVVSGSDALPRDTWFPVPREGILGSLRTCDLVVPCPGVASRHLDFSWKDGTGLLVRPRSGCEVLADGVPVTARSAPEASPLIHGSFLQVGSALLRLQLFSALEHTSRDYAPGMAAPYGAAPGPAVPPDVPFPQPSPLPDAAAVLPGMPDPSVFPPEPTSGIAPGALPAPEAYPAPAEAPLPPAPESPVPRRKRADRWKEDWSE